MDYWWLPWETVQISERSLPTNGNEGWEHTPRTGGYYIRCVADVNKCIIYDILLTNKWYTEYTVWLNYIVWFLIENVVEEKAVRLMQDYYFGKIKLCCEKELKLQYSFREDYWCFRGD